MQFPEDAAFEGSVESASRESGYMLMASIVLVVMSIAIAAVTFYSSRKGRYVQVSGNATSGDPGVGHKHTMSAIGEDKAKIFEGIELRWDDTSSSAILHESIVDSEDVISCSTGSIAHFPVNRSDQTTSQHFKTLRAHSPTLRVTAFDTMPETMLAFSYAPGGSSTDTPSPPKIVRSGYSGTVAASKVEPSMLMCQSPKDTVLDCYKTTSFSSEEDRQFSVPEESSTFEVGRREITDSCTSVDLTSFGDENDDLETLPYIPTLSHV